MESEGYSSLFALVDSHLSQTSLKDTGTNEKGKSSLPISCAKGFHNGSVSESFLFSPKQKFPIPTLSANESPISCVLAEQVSNMLKAKERKQKEAEKSKLEEQMNKLKLDNDEDYVIDLMKALQPPTNSSRSEKILCRNGSSELVSSNFTNEERRTQFNSLTYLPCMTDLSYILNKKIRKGKCSPFGKVLTSKLRPVAAPYLKENIKSDIIVFDFGTKSPCDIIKENLKKPASYSTHNCSIITQFMLE